MVTDHTDWVELVDTKTWQGVWVGRHAADLRRARLPKEKTLASTRVTLFRLHANLAVG